MVVPIYNVRASPCLPSCSLLKRRLDSNPLANDASRACYCYVFGWMGTSFSSCLPKTLVRHQRGSRAIPANVTFTQMTSVIFLTSVTKRKSIPLMPSKNIVFLFVNATRDCIVQYELTTHGRIDFTVKFHLRIHWICTHRNPGLPLWSHPVGGGVISSQGLLILLSCNESRRLSLHCHTPFCNSMQLYSLLFPV